VIIKRLTLLTALLLLASLGACAGSTGGLDGSAWELIELDGTPTIAGTTLTIAFAEASAGGAAGCNTYGASYRLKDDAITFSEIASTLMACMEPGVMEQESAFLAFLQDARSFAVKDGFLYIYNEAGSALMFKPQ